MDLMQRVINLESGKRLPNDDEWMYITHLLCTTYGWTLNDLKKQPIRFCLSMLRQIAKDKKRESERMGQGNKGLRGFG